MKVLTIQSTKLDVQDRVYADVTRCNHPGALEVYKRLFSDYNRIKGTEYEGFFWGFSELLTDDLDYAVECASAAIGTYEGKVYVLDIPDELCLETDFYNFSNEIYANSYPEELESCWESIYDKRHSEKQVIFPYIEPGMIIYEKELVKTCLEQKISNALVKLKDSEAVYKNINILENIR